MKDHQIGERFEHHGRMFECIQSGKGCSFCGFRHEYTSGNCPQHCLPSEREDKNIVLFKEITV